MIWHDQIAFVYVHPFRHYRPKSINARPLMPDEKLGLIHTQFITIKHPLYFSLCYRSTPSSCPKSQPSCVIFIPTDRNCIIWPCFPKTPKLWSALSPLIFTPVKNSINKLALHWMITYTISFTVYIAHLSYSFAVNNFVRSGKKFKTHRRNRHNKLSSIAFQIQVKRCVYSKALTTTNTSGEEASNTLFVIFRLVTNFPLMFAFCFTFLSFSNWKL